MGGLSSSASYNPDFPDGFEGWHIQESMEMALKDGHVGPRDGLVIYGSANGGPKLDKAEMAALAGIVPRREGEVRVSSVKSVTGEMQGADGIFNLIAAIYTLKTKRVIPIQGFKGAEYDLPFVERTEELKDTNLVLCNSASYTGHSVSILVRGEGN